MSVNLAQLNLSGFDSSQVEPDDFSDLPAGAYPSMIVDSSVKAVKAPKVGNYLELQFEVIDGPHAGRKFWDRLNLDNPNVMTREIATKALSSIARAVGIFGPIPNGDTGHLHGKPLMATISYKEKGGDTHQNFRYAALNAGAVGQVANAAAPAANAATAAPAAKPWER